MVRLKRLFLFLSVDTSSAVLIWLWSIFPATVSNIFFVCVVDICSLQLKILGKLLKPSFSESLNMHLI